MTDTFQANATAFNINTSRLKIIDGRRNPISFRESPIDLWNREINSQERLNPNIGVSLGKKAFVKRIFWDSPYTESVSAKLTYPGGNNRPRFPTVLKPKRLVRKKYGKGIGVDNLGTHERIPDFGRFSQIFRSNTKSDFINVEPIPKPAVRLTGRVESVCNNTAFVTLHNHNSGEDMEAECDARQLKANSIAQGDEFSCDVFKTGPDIKVHFKRLIPKQLTKEQFLRILDEVKDIEL